MFCPKCGSPIKNEAVFCGKCGANLQDAFKEYTSNTNTPEQQVPEKALPPTMQEKKGGRLGLIFGAAVGIIAVIVIIAVILVRGTGGDGEKASVSSTPPSSLPEGITSDSSRIESLAGKGVDSDLLLAVIGDRLAHEASSLSTALYIRLKGPFSEVYDAAKPFYSIYADNLIPNKILYCADLTKPLSRWIENNNDSNVNLADFTQEMLSMTATSLPDLLASQSQDYVTSVLTSDTSLYKTIYLECEIETPCAVLIEYVADSNKLLAWACFQQLKENVISVSVSNVSLLSESEVFDEITSDWDAVSITQFDNISKSLSPLDLNAPADGRTMTVDDYVAYAEQIMDDVAIMDFKQATETWAFGYSEEAKNLVLGYQDAFRGRHSAVDSYSGSSCDLFVAEAMNAFWKEYEKDYTAIGEELIDKSLLGYYIDNMRTSMASNLAWNAVAKNYSDSNTFIADSLFKNVVIQNCERGINRIPKPSNWDGPVVVRYRYPTGEFDVSVMFTFYEVGNGFIGLNFDVMREETGTDSLWESLAPYGFNGAEATIFDSLREELESSADSGVGSAPASAPPAASTEPAALGGSAAGVSNGSATVTGKGPFTIGIIQFVYHEALDTSIQGFKDALAEKMGDVNTFILQNANASKEACYTIAADFEARGVDMILAVATVPLQAASETVQWTPILGTCVTDYAEALNINPWTGITGRNISGTSDYGLESTSEYYNLGYKTGIMAYEILVNGVDIATLPIQYG